MTNFPTASTQVNPTFDARANQLPQAISAVRSPRGRFASPEAPYGVQEVWIPNAWTTGFRVGPNGRIFAKKADAVKFAKARIAKLSHESVNAN